MNIFKKSCIALMLCILLSACGNEFRFSPKTVISVESEDQKAVAEWFAWLFARPGGFVPKVEVDAFGADVLLRTDLSLDESSYRIKTTGRRTCIEASSASGFFYALQYIRHALPKAIDAPKHADHVEWVIPAMTVQGAPDTECSGLLLDLSCRLVLKDNVLHLIESMPYMGIYEMTVINDNCYSQEDLDQIHQCALENNIRIILQNEVDALASSEGYELIWQDDFDDVDGRYWSRITRGNPDWRRYMSTHDSLFRIDGGCLVMKALANDGIVPSDTASFLTGGVYTKGKFHLTHGKVEVRAKLPMAKSVWPAIWLMPQSGQWPDAGEIDIMEHINHDRHIYQTVHSKHTASVSRQEPPSSARVKVDPERYNIYGVEILPDSLVFRVNGRKTFTYPRVRTGRHAGAAQYPFGTPYYILIDMQIGGAWAGPAAGDDLPAEMMVDWVKVYDLK